LTKLELDGRGIAARPSTRHDDLLGHRQIELKAGEIG
jgi:hypothetical protein